MKTQFAVLKKTIGLLLLAVMLCLSACGAPADQVEDSTPAEQTKKDTPSSSEPADAGAEGTPSKVTHSTQGVSFEVSEDWLQAEGMDMFYTDKNEVYGLNGVSPLGSYEPQALYEELSAYYSGQFDTFSAPEELTAWQSSDGVECLTADFTGVYESVLYCTKVVIAPQKNLVLTFDAQAYKDRQEPTVVWMVLNQLCESLTFEIGTQDEISGNTFLCGDSSQLCFQDGGDFRWYQSAEDHEHQYYEGVYEVYRGQEAMDQVASMTEYGLTMEELEQVLAASMNGYIPGGSRPSDYLYATGELEDGRERYQVCLDTFYAVILHNQRLVSSPEEVQEGGNSTLYIGFYLPELGMADLTNCNAGSNAQWTFQEKTA